MIVDKTKVTDKTLADDILAVLDKHLGKGTKKKFVMCYVSEQRIGDIGICHNHSLEKAKELLAGTLVMLQAFKKKNNE